MHSKNEQGAAHFAAFVDAITAVARKVLESVGDEQMLTIFHDSVNAHEPKRTMKDAKVKKIRELLNDTPLPYVRNDIVEAFAEMGVESGSNIDEKFQLLLELQDKYKNRTTKAWRPPVDPHQHMRGFRVAAQRELLDKLQVLVAMKRHQVDHLKEQIREIKASSDLRQTEAGVMEVKRRLERVHDLNARFKETHEQVVDRIAEAVEKNMTDSL